MKPSETPQAVAGRRLLLSHPAFPSHCAELAREPLGIEEISLPAGPAEAESALAPLREPGTRFVTDSERFLGFAPCFPEEKCRALSVLRDKAVFRRTIQEADDVLAVRSRVFGKAELGALSWGAVLAELGAPPDGVVVKPVRGFQSDLVSICRDAADWERALARVAAPPPGTSQVTDVSTFVVETYVRGEELALDVYFDERGAPVILGIYLHPFRDPLDARDIVYRTSRALMRRHRERFESALAAWNRRLGLRDFPVHAEVRVTERGEVFPIEFNPLRFGLLTMDISLYAFGVNAYLHYFWRTAPAWGELESGAEADRETATGLIVAPMPALAASGGGSSGERVVEVDYEAFEAGLRARGLRIHRLQRLPYEEIPFYAAVYASGPAAAMDSYLHEDFGRHVRWRS
jgi:hypothetical protein